MKYRKSKLQKEILELLKDHKPRTQKEISEIIGVNASSISRSIRKLIEQGQIRKDVGGYVKKGATIAQLTSRTISNNSDKYLDRESDESNRMAKSTFNDYYQKNIGSAISSLGLKIPRPIQQLEDMANRFHHIITPLNNLAALINTIDLDRFDEMKRAMEGIEESMRVSEITTLDSMKMDIGLNILSEKMDTYTSIQNELDKINKSTEEANKALVSSLGSFDELKRSLEEIKIVADPHVTNQYKSLAEIAGIGASTLNQMYQTEDAIDNIRAIEESFRLGMESTIENYQHGLESILNTDLKGILDVGIPPILSEELLESIKEASLSMNELITRNLQGNINELIPIMPEICRTLELSSLTYRDMGVSFRNLAPDPYEEYNEPAEHESTDETEFRALLMNLDRDSHYVAMWEGAWITVNTSNPDKVRQSIHSMRTLFDCILRDYAPDAEARQYNHLSKDEIIARKHRLKYIMRGAPKDEIELVESYAKTFILQLDYLHKVSHTKIFPNQLPVKYVLKLCEDIICIITQWTYGLN